MFARAARLTFDDVSARASLAPRTVLAGRYRLLQALGEGAVGAVFLAEHIHMRKRFALKVLHRDAATPEVVHRFRAEAIAAANIGHPGIAAAHDFGVLDDGSLFLVLEYVPGESLAKVLERGPLPVRRALTIARNILVALGAAHAKGIVHRDVKPANIMVCDGNESVKLLDFGIAHLDRTAFPDDERLTRLGLIYGSADYMAPEQAAGMEIDPRADLYAVGATLYEMISGRTPFVGSAFEVLAAHISTPSPPLGGPEPRALTRETHDVVARLLAKQRENRPANASEAIALVDVALASIEVPRTRVIVPAPRPQPRRRPFVLAAALALTALLIASVGAHRAHSQENVSVVGLEVRTAPPPPVPVVVKPPPAPVAKSPPPKKKVSKHASTGGLRGKLRAIFK